MRVSTIQLNSSSPNFNGVVSVRNLMTRNTRTYKTTPEVDRSLAESYDRINSALNVDSGIIAIKRYVNELYKITKDEFLNKLPPLVKEEFQEFEVSARATYATYKGGTTFSELKTNGFEITHDMAK